MLRLLGECHPADRGRLRQPPVQRRDAARDGTISDVSSDPGAVLGYSIVAAESLDDAIALLDGCPMDMWVYEAMPK
jgi:hypothetical protein